MASRGLPHEVIPSTPSLRSLSCTALDAPPALTTLNVTQFAAARLKELRELERAVSQPSSGRALQVSRPV